MRKKFVIANWKMNLGAEAEALQFADLFLKDLSSLSCEISICPPFTVLSTLKLRLQGSQVLLGAQNCFWEESGAYTGEVSAAFLQAAGCRVVVIGHSERREYFAETDAQVRAKVALAIKQELIPVVCVGETLAERENNFTFQKIALQLEHGLADFGPADFAKIVIAYEPVWAIGTGKTATPQQAQEVHGYIRERLRSQFGSAAEQTRILYGGSVKPNNAAELMSQPDIDGALVGGASLVPEDFLKIAQAAKN